MFDAKAMSDNPAYALASDFCAWLNQEALKAAGSLATTATDPGPTHDTPDPVDAPASPLQGDGGPYPDPNWSD